MPSQTLNKDVYSRVTERIIADLEKGVRPWMKPWNAGNAAGKITRPLRHNGQPYSGINILMLWASGMEQGYRAPYWMTFKQAQEFGAHVRKGEKSSLVVYANKITVTGENAEGEDESREVPFMKGYAVFNCEQIEGLPEHYYATPEPRLTPVQRIDHAENFFASTRADIRYRGGRAYYALEADYIQLPPIEAFESPESYYATLAHETTHWTRHASRLDRDMGRKAWGDEGYAREELVAELGAAFLSADLELTPEVREDHAAYIEPVTTPLLGESRDSYQHGFLECCHRRCERLVCRIGLQALEYADPEVGHAEEDPFLFQLIRNQTRRRGLRVEPDVRNDLAKSTRQCFRSHRSKSYVRDALAQAHLDLTKKCEVLLHRNNVGTNTSMALWAGTCGWPPSCPKNIPQRSAWRKWVSLGRTA